MGNSKLRQVTLCLLVKDNQVLLAMKKREFEVGKWNGVGGKLQEGETVEQGAIREAQEEIRVTPLSLQKVAVIDYLFPEISEDKNWNQQMNVFLVKDWKGEPLESDEMNPKWFPISEVPYDKMWESDSIWMRKVLEGKKIKGSFVYANENKLEEYKIVDQ